jgi:hypothetical protein
MHYGKLLSPVLRELAGLNKINPGLAYVEIAAGQSGAGG